MTKRKGMSRKMRFEVFKRDSFTCQYCGGKSPEVILQVDHIVPVADGGTDDILNLTTSCMECNSGKGARPLSENATIERKRAQIEMLQERREQMQMIYEWQQELAKISEEEVDYIQSVISERTNFALTESGRKKVCLWIRNWGFSEILSATRESLDRYYRKEKDWEEFFGRIPRIVKWRKLQQEDPEAARYSYIGGILRNRFTYVNWGTYRKIVESWRTWYPTLTIEELETLAKTAGSWSNFCNVASERMISLREEQEAEKKEESCRPE